MMNYLTLLAARSLGQMPVVQPRLPSRFEPAGPPFSSWGDDPETGAALRHANPPESIHANTTEPPAQSGARRKPADSGGEQPSDPSRQSAHLATLTRDETPQTSSNKPGHADRRQPDPPQPTPASATINDAAASFIVAEHSIPPQPAPAPMSPPSASRRAIPPDSATPPSRTSSSSPRQTDRAQERTTRNDSPPPVRRSSDAPAKPDPNAGGPAIRITIGRVEIRAVNNSSKDRRPRPAPGPPVLSLEDYLKERKARLK